MPNMLARWLIGTGSLLAVMSGSPSFATTPAAGRTAAAKADSFYLKDGDRVVFYGDSITDQRLYTTYIESYCVTRFPKRNFKFVHAGWGGDRVTGGGGGPINVRIIRDILPYRPTVVTICLGMNDGSYAAFDQGIFDSYIQGYRHIIDTLKSDLPGVRITLLTAPAYDDVTRPAKFPGGYNATLKRYGEAVAGLASEYHLTLADTNAPLVEALEKAKTRDPEIAAQLIPDRVHPGPGGHMVMAEAVLKAWKAPADVAEIAIDAGRARVVMAADTQVTNLKVTKDGVAFTHLDGALPWPLDRAAGKNRDMELALQVTDAESALDRYRLKVTGLPAAKYALKVDGMEITQVSAADLSAGLDLASLPDLPSNRQAAEVLDLTRKHNDIHFRRWREVQFPVSKNNEDPPAAVKEQMISLDKQEAAVEQQLHVTTQPKPHRIELIAVS